MNNITIYTKDNCSFCTKAKMLLSSKSIQYTELKLNQDFTKENLLEIFPMTKTFPVIVVDSYNIGGYNELEKFLVESKQEDRKFLVEGI